MSRGFLAMEYWGLILNRSFVVFIHPSGLYGWKFKGPVSTSNPLYFENYEHFVTEPDPAYGSDAFKEVMSGRGSFFIGRDDIADVTLDPTSKWGMGPVPHTGKLRVRMTSGKSREFILLGDQDGEAVRTAVLAAGTTDPRPP